LVQNCECHSVALVGDVVAAEHRVGLVAADLLVDVSIDAGADEVPDA
jgi:hypothetical protein